jgi:hypothetical protein
VPPAAAVATATPDVAAVGGNVTGDTKDGGGQSVDGADLLVASSDFAVHGPGLVEVARGGSRAGSTGGLPSYLLVSYHTPLSQFIVELAPSIATAAAGSLAWAAFVLFGKRRRDGDAGELESELATAAATGLEIPAGQDLSGVDESLIPRWRRPSLQQVRRTDPLRAVAEAPSLSFAASGLETGDDYERRQIRYRLVRLLDCPDELRSAEIGVLDHGDEVLLLERRGVYWLVLCPDGRRGWVHRMTLADPSQDEVPQVVPWEDPSLVEGLSTESVLAEEPVSDADESDTGYLEAYIQARSDLLHSMSATPAEPLAAPRVPVEEPSVDVAPAGESGCAGERYSGRKRAGTRKAATGSQPGTKSRRPSR